MMDPSDNLEPEQDFVLAALYNPEYTWRTVDGIAEESGLSYGDVVWILDSLGDHIVRCSRLTTDGRPLFTTRDRYRTFEHWWRRLLAAVKNRAD